MSLFKSLSARRGEYRKARNHRPVEVLEDRRLLSASVVIDPGGPIVLPNSSPVTGLTIHATDGVKFSGPVADWTTNLTLPQPATALIASASIQWGDGTSSAGTFVADGKGLVQIDGTHTYTKPGTFDTLINVIERPVVKPGQPQPQFIVEVGQGHGEALVARQTAGSVNIYAKVNQQFTGTVADLNFHVPANATAAFEYSATINWGDGVTSTGAFVSASSTANSQVVGSHTYASSGIYNVQVVVTYDPFIVDPLLPPGGEIGTPTPTPVITIIDSLAFVSKPIIGLDGTITGSYSPAPVAADIGATYVFNGAGTAGALGKVSAHGIVTVPGFVATGNATGTLTLTTVSSSAAESGSVTLKLTGPTEKGFGPFPTTLSYTITGGTGAWAKVAGTGTIDVVLDPTKLQFTFVIHSILPPA